MSGGFFDLSSPTFKPTVRLVSSISKGTTTTIATSTAHSYIAGMIVKILVPDRIDDLIGPNGLTGMTQINNKTGKILTIIDEFTFTVDIDSTGYDSFSIPVTWLQEVGLYPQVVPFAEDASMDTAAVRNVL